MKINTLFLILLAGIFFCERLHAFTTNQQTDIANKIMDSKTSKDEAIKLANDAIRFNKDRMTTIDYGWAADLLKRRVLSKGVTEQEWYEKVLSIPGDPKNQVFFPKAGSVPQDIQTAIDAVRDAAQQVALALHKKLNPQGANDWTWEVYGTMRSILDALTPLVKQASFLPAQAPTK